MKQTNIAKKPKGRLITPEDVEGVCRLVARGMSQTHAAARIGLNPPSFANWVSENRLKYNDLLTRLKASRVDGLLSNVERAANGEDGVRLDWRASQWLLQVVAPEFREDKGQAPPAPSVVNIAVLDSLSRMVYSVESPPAQPMALPAVEAGGADQRGDRVGDLVGG